MISIATVDLRQRQIRFPNNRVGMVLAQPYLPNTYFAGTEPYRFTAQAKPRQISAIARTLEVALQAPHGLPKTHFTVFPEYSIPGADGIAEIERVLGSDRWPIGSVVIGGTDALTRDEYRHLLEQDSTHVDETCNHAGAVPKNHWVNCAVTWIKSAHSLERWIQPKLHPAWDERNVRLEQMFRGGSVFLFSGRLETDSTPFQFATLICYDWIASIGGQLPVQALLADIHSRADGYQQPLSWVFVIQRNRKPSDESFLTGIIDFFDQTQSPNAIRTNACLIFANTAGRDTPGRAGDYGGTSVVFSPQSQFKPGTCPPTVSNGGARFRNGSNLLLKRNCKDVYFRESGACIHSFAQVNPGSINTGPERVLPVDRAYVFPVLGASEPRTPGEAVAAAVKWTNDELDDATSMSVHYQDAALRVNVDALHNQAVGAVRSLSASRAKKAIELATQRSGAKNEDEWQKDESLGLEHLLNTLAILGVALGMPELDVGQAHARVQIRNEAVEVSAVRGVSHDDCIKHSRAHLPVRRNATLLVSRDYDNNACYQRDGSFLRTRAPRLGEERKITDPEGGMCHLGYRNILDVFKTAATPMQLESDLYAALTQ